MAKISKEVEHKIENPDYSKSIDKIIELSVNTVKSLEKALEILKKIEQNTSKGY